MDPNLIPAPDMLGLPALPWLLQILMALTLALHWAFLGFTIAGTLAMLAVLLKKERGIEQQAFLDKLVPILPFTLNLAMTMGVAPLLFVQVLYGNFFYSSNILMGYVWLGILPLLIVNFYCYYIAWYCVGQQRPIPPVLPVASLGLGAAIAFILSSNAVLMQQPEAWESMRPSMGFMPYLGDHVIFARWLLALASFAAFGGLAVGAAGRGGLLGNGGGVARSLGRTLALAAGAAQLVLLAGFVIMLPGDQRAVMLSGAEALFFYVAVAAMVAGLAVAAAIFGGEKPGQAAVIAAPVLFFVGLLGAAAIRDTIRREALSEYFKLSEFPLHPEWSSLALFLTVFTAGLGIIVWLIRMANDRIPEPAAEEPA